MEKKYGVSVAKLNELKELQQTRQKKRLKEKYGVIFPEPQQEQKARSKRKRKRKKGEVLTGTKYGVSVAKLEELKDIQWDRRMNKYRSSISISRLRRANVIEMVTVHELLGKPSRITLGLVKGEMLIDDMFHFIKILIRPRAIAALHVRNYEAKLEFSDCSYYKRCTFQFRSLDQLQKFVDLIPQTVKCFDHGQERSRSSSGKTPQAGLTQIDSKTKPEGLSEGTESETAKSDYSEKTQTTQAESESETKPEDLVGGGKTTETTRAESESRTKPEDLVEGGKSTEMSQAESESETKPEDLIGGGKTTETNQAESESQTTPVDLVGGGKTTETTQAESESETKPEDLAGGGKSTEMSQAESESETKPEDLIGGGKTTETSGPDVNNVSSSGETQTKLTETKSDIKLVTGTATESSESDFDVSASGNTQTSLTEAKTETKSVINREGLVRGTPSESFESDFDVPGSGKIQRSLTEAKTETKPEDSSPKAATETSFNVSGKTETKSETDPVVLARGARGLDFNVFGSGRTQTSRIEAASETKFETSGEGIVTETYLNVSGSGKPQTTTAESGSNPEHLVIRDTAETEVSGSRKTQTSTTKVKSATKPPEDLGRDIAIETQTTETESETDPEDVAGGAGTEALELDFNVSGLRKTQTTLTEVESETSLQTYCNISGLGKPQIIQAESETNPENVFRGRATEASRSDFNASGLGKTQTSLTESESEAKPTKTSVSILGSGKTRTTQAESAANLENLFRGTATEAAGSDFNDSGLGKTQTSPTEAKSETKPTETLVSISGAEK